MPLNKGKQVRKPDIALICKNSQQIQGEDRRYHGIFDICIEFLSDSKASEVERDVVDKKKEYEEAGVKEYFIIDRKKVNTAFYRLENNAYKNIESPDGVIRSKVLEGFQFRIEHLYSQPNFKDLVDDPVYKDFVCLDYQEEKKRAKMAEKRAQMAEKRAQMAEKRAMEYKKMLEDIGITF